MKTKTERIDSLESTVDYLYRRDDLLRDLVSQVTALSLRVGVLERRGGESFGSEGGDAIQEREEAEEKEEGVGRPRFARSLTWDMAVGEVTDRLLELRLSGEYSYMYSHMDEHKATRLRDALNEWLATKGTTDASQDNDQSSIDARSDDDPREAAYAGGSWEVGYDQGSGIGSAQLKGTDG